MKKAKKKMSFIEAFFDIEMVITGIFCISYASYLAWHFILSLF